MFKKISLIVIIVCVLAGAGALGLGIAKSNEAKKSFSESGAVLLGDNSEDRTVSFSQGTEYTRTLDGHVNFRSSDGNAASVVPESFVRYEDSTFTAFSDGVLVNFKDLSDNFINNYFMAQGTTVTKSAGSYMITSGTGDVEVSDHIWKLTDQKYLIESPTMQVCYSETDVRPVADYLQVTVTDDGIVHMLSADDLWLSVSDTMYIQTESGVKIYPLNDLIESAEYQMSLAKLSVSPEDNIVLSALETRRQIVPKLIVDAKDGADGEDGNEGDDGSDGVSGINGTNGQNGIEGEEGEGGNDGSNGEDGVAGSIGSSGRSGTDGKSGSSGINGEDGALGAAGADGRDGAGRDTSLDYDPAYDGSSGVNGADGDSIRQAQAGSTGSNGTRGNNGSAGTDGRAGEGGSNGLGGGDGSSGVNGAKGTDSRVRSTTNAAIPTLAIDEWQIGEKYLRGTIKITDNSEFFDESLADDNHPAYVTIYDETTGDSYHCYPTTDPSSSEHEESYDFGKDLYGTGAEEMYFTTDGSPLSPDSTYRLVVNAFYKDLTTNMVYQRDFVYRIFSTLSTGISIAHDFSDTTSMGLLAELTEDGKDSISSAVILMLTPEQNEGFIYSPTAANYKYKYMIDYQNRQATGWYVDDAGTAHQDTQHPMPVIQTTEPSELTFWNLAADTAYVARVYVTTKTGLQTLTRAELDVRTLKRLPVWNADDPVLASYNRITDGFEVYRPKIADPDFGIESYTYTAYEVKTVGGATVYDPVKTRDLKPNEAEPAVFYLDNATNYKFGVTANFFDNEKDVAVEIGMNKDIVRADGYPLPKITFDAGTEWFDRIEGASITINLTDKDTMLLVDHDHDLLVDITADQITYTQAISFNDNHQEKSDPSGKELYSFAFDRTDTNYAKLSFTMDHLFRNTKYTITLRGYLSDGSGGFSADQYRLRELGAVSFRTKDSIATVANWEAMSSGGSGTDTKIAKTLKIGANDTTVDPQERLYDLNELQQGQVLLHLYMGKGTTKKSLATTSVFDEDDLYQIYGVRKDAEGHLEVDPDRTGFVVTEQTFGYSSSDISSSSEYTISVEQITDPTYKLELGYVNEFTIPKNPNTTVTAQASTPDLSTTPESEVKVTPITNIEAALYGGAYDKNMPDDMIIGYRLRSTYDNTEHLARKVTYYAFEYKQFFNAVTEAGIDPILDENVPKLMVMTQGVDPLGDTVPEVAVLFGGTKTPSDDQARSLNGCMVYQSGSAVVTTTLDRGMGRGFRYLFAYTVEYAMEDGEGGTTTTGTYPYDRDNWESYKKKYGCGKENEKPIGVNVTYILNSGMVNCEKIAPVFHTYVYSTEMDAPATAYSGVSGHLQIHYAWEDTDGVIIVDSTDEEAKTKIKFNNAAGEPVQQLIKDGAHKVAGTSDWYWFEPHFNSGRYSDDLVKPSVNVSLFSLDYSQVLYKLELDDEHTGKDSTYYICTVPVDWNYGSYFGSNQNGVYFSQIPHLADNYIEYTFFSESGADLYMQLAQRAYNVELTYTDKADPANKVVVNAPLQIDEVTSEVTAKVSSGQLSDLFGKTIQTTAKILYDDGRIGFQVSEGANTVFAAQRVNSDETDDFKLYLYMKSSSEFPQLPMAASLVNSGNANYAQLVRNAYAEGGKYFLDKYYQTLGSKAGRIYTYLYPHRYGVDYHTSSDTRFLSGHYLVFKGCAAYVLKSEGSVEFTLDQVTPTVQYYAGRAAQFSYELASETYVEGVEMAAEEGGKHILHAALFDADHLDDAKALNLDKVVKDASGNDMILDIELVYRSAETDAQNKWRMPTNSALRTFEGLEEEKPYYIALYMKSKGTGNMILIDAITTEKAVYGFTTVSGVQITSDIGVVYNNASSYFDKSLEILFKLNRYFGVKAEYDLYYDEECTEPLLSYADLKAASMLNEPSLRNENNLMIYLTPSADSAKLVPGGIYWLKITAKEGTSVVGSNVFRVSIPSIGNFGAQVYAAEATTDKVVFNVTLVDSQFVLMGHNTKDQQAARYAVRFTYVDANGIETRLKTTYDDQVFTALDLRKEFVLDNDHLVLYDPITGPSLAGQEIKKESEYTIHVYAVKDPDLDGLSPAVAPGDTEGKSWEYFFTNGSSQDYSPTVFINLIDSFWDAGTLKKRPVMAPVEANFSIFTKRQNTTDENLLYVSDNAIFTRASATRFKLVLQESYGLIQNDEQMIKCVEWNIEGTANDGTPIDITETTKATAAGNVPFYPSTLVDFPVYAFDIPRNLPAGRYTAVFDLYLQQDPGPEDTPYRRFSFTYFG